MKTTLYRAFIGAFLCLAMCACGAGQGAATEGPYMLSVQVEGQDPIMVEGIGATPEDRAYDAVAYVVSSIQVGTGQYRAMLSERGLYVYVGEALYIVTIRPDGMYIGRG